MRQLQLQCAVDNEITPHNQPTPNHVVHALVSVFLIGFWIPVWILIAVGAGKDPATCVKCGNRRPPDGPAVVLKPIVYKGVNPLLLFGGIGALIGAAVVFWLITDQWA